MIPELIGNNSGLKPESFRNAFMNPLTMQLTFKTLYFIKDAPRVFCYDDNLGEYRVVGPFRRGDVAEFAQSCADVYLEMGVARLATEDEVVDTYSRKYGIDKEKLRQFLSELRQQP